MLLALALSWSCSSTAPPSPQPPAAPVPTGPVVAAAPTADVAAAEALITALYAPYLVDDGITPPLKTALPWAPEMQAAWDRHAAPTEEGQAPPGFDPFVDGQDYQVRSLTVNGSPEPGGGVLVVAAFENFGTPTTVSYTLVGTGSDWRVADVRGRGGSLLKTLREWQP